MKIVITKTDTMAQFDGVPCRMWRGVLVGKAVACSVFVHRIAFPEDYPVDELEQLPAPASEASLAPAINESMHKATLEILMAHMRFVMALSKLLTGDEHFAAKAEEQGGDGLQDVFDQVALLKQQASVSRTDAG